MFRILIAAFRPIYIYASWFIHASKYLLKHKTLKLAYKARLRNVKLGKYNAFEYGSFLSNSTIGDYSYLSDNTRINNAHIGSFTCIGSDVLIGMGTHPTSKFVSLHPAFFSKSKQAGITFVEKNHFKEYHDTVHIGDDVWIGARSIITCSIKIGTGAIIAANSVVTKDVEPYAIVAGVPAKKICSRFTEQQNDYILRSKWWEKTQDFYMHNIELFHDVDLFCKKWDSVNNKDA